MFIKRDRRRIEEIIQDEKDSKEVLKLSKRSSEFNNTIQILANEKYLNYLKNLRVLNLYDNSLQTVVGIEKFCDFSRLEEINLGSNRLRELPAEFGSLQSLQILWLDDNQFEQFPSSVCRLNQLRVLRMSGNQIAEIPDILQLLINLETLCLDSNEINQIPDGLFKITKLKHLWLRQNRISNVQSAIQNLTNLEVFSISSNLLQELPSSIASLQSLKFLYANGNRIKIVEDTFVRTIPSLQEVNLSNNEIASIPKKWFDESNDWKPSIGELTMETHNHKCRILLLARQRISDYEKILEKHSVNQGKTLLSRK